MRSLLKIGYDFARKNAIIISEQDYNSMVETLHFLSNPVNAEKLLSAVNRSVKDTISSWQQAKD